MGCRKEFHKLRRKINIMNMMKKIPFEIEINIAGVPNRNCKFFQEQIYEYHDSGKARFEWDRLRQEFILGKDFSIERICNPCPLNLLLDIEGCKGELFDFEVFTRMLPNIKPDSILLQKNLLNCSFNTVETIQLVEEIESLQEKSWFMTWPVAQVYMDNEPLVLEESIKYKNFVYYEWTGEDDHVFFASNKGYHVGMVRDGIILKKNYGETLPDVFVSLARKGMRTLGKNKEGSMIPIPMHQASHPEWLPENPGYETELRFTSLPIPGVFQDIFNMIIIFGKSAIKEFTGISIYSRFYRRE
jgi:hypothetical protein